MPQLTSPGWLAALGVLAIPILLHLWSRRPGQVVRLGSLRHLRGAPGARGWGRRLDEWPLLAMRCGFLAAVVLAVAGPLWRPAAPPKGSPVSLVLADPRAVADSLAFYSDPMVDSLRRTGAPIHLLAEGFPQLGLPGGGSPSQLGRPAMIWSQLRELDDSLPPGSDLLILGSPRAGELGAGRPRIAATVRWHPLAADDERLTVQSWQGPSDSLGFLLEQRSGNNLTLRWIATMAGQRDPISGPGTDPRLTTRSVTPPSVYVVADQRDSDEVRSAVAALAVASQAAHGFTARIETIGPAEVPSPTQGGLLLVWLSGQSVSDSLAALVHAGATILQFPAEASERRAGTEFHPSGPGSLDPDLVVRAFTLSEPPVGAPIMEDAFGNPLLTFEAFGRGRWLRAATRIDAGWSDIATSGALPELLMTLLAPGAEAARRAPVSSSQALPIRGTSPPQRTAALPLQILLLVLAGALLLGERLLANRGGSQAG